MTKKKYFIPYIYLPVLVCMIWASITYFSKPIHFITYCFITITLMYMLQKKFYHRAEALEDRGAEALAVNVDHYDNEWYSFSAQVEEHVNKAGNTPLSKSLEKILENSKEIAKAVENKQERANNQYLRRFIDCYEVFSVDISDYLSCSQISQPGRNVQTILRKIEHKFQRLANISKQLLDEAFSTDILTIGAGDNVLDHLFSSLEKDDFDSPIDNSSDKPAEKESSQPEKNNDKKEKEKEKDRIKLIL